MTRRLSAVLLVLFLFPLLAAADDHFLTIGGGGSPQNNQVSLERNVVYFRHTLADCGLAAAPQSVLFACGNDPKTRDLQYDDPKNDPPRANILVARLWDMEDDLYHHYRPHDLADVSGPATRAAINQWFATVGARLAEGDRLFIYFTGHGGAGNRQSPRNTTMDLWLDGAMTVREFTGLLDKLNRKVQVVLIMVQCHSGGFGGVLFPGGDAGPVLAQQLRCGFFATWSDRLAAGCTPDTREDDYKDYTTYFFAALSGHTRGGQPLPPHTADYDHDGRVSLAEAHAYVLLTSDTIDIPVRTSDVLLRQFSKMRDDRVKDLVTPSPDFAALLEHATPDRRAVLEGLAKQLDLQGDDKFAAARSMAESIDRQRRLLEPPRRGRGGGGPNPNRERDALRDQIRARVLARWPELASAYHPGAIAALTTQADEIVRTIESHPAYKRWDALVQEADAREDKSFELERRWVKCQRLLYTAESVALEANLDKFAGKLVQSRYQALRAAENATLGKPPAEPH